MKKFFKYIILFAFCYFNIFIISSHSYNKNVLTQNLAPKGNKIVLNEEFYINVGDILREILFDKCNFSSDVFAILGTYATNIGINIFNDKMTFSANEKHLAYAACGNTLAYNKRTAFLVTMNVGSAPAFPALEFANKYNIPIAMIVGSMIKKSSDQNALHHSLENHNGLAKISQMDNSLEFAKSILGEENVFRFDFSYASTKILNSNGNELFKNMISNKSFKKNIYRLLEFIDNANKNSRPVYIEIPKHIPAMLTVNKEIKAWVKSLPVVSNVKRLEKNWENERFMEIFGLNSPFSKRSKSESPIVLNDHISLKQLPNIIYNYYGKKSIHIVDSVRGNGIPMIQGINTIGEAIPILYTSEIALWKGFAGVIKEVLNKKESIIVFSKQGYNENINYRKFFSGLGAHYIKLASKSTIKELYEKLNKKNKSEKIAPIFIEINDKELKKMSLMNENYEDIQIKPNSFIDILIKFFSKILKTKYVFTHENYFNGNLNSLFQKYKIENINVFDDVNAATASGFYASYNNEFSLCFVDSLKDSANGVFYSMAENNPTVFIRIFDSDDTEIKSAYASNMSTFLIDDINKVNFNQLSQFIQNEVVNKKQSAYIGIKRDLIFEELPKIKSNINSLNRISVDYNYNPMDIKKKALELYEFLLECSKHDQTGFFFLGSKFKYQKELTKSFIKLAEILNVPFATNFYAKSINDSHPLCVGEYCGKISSSRVLEYVDRSDFMIYLGRSSRERDIGTGFGTQKNFNRQFDLNGEDPYGYELNLIIQSLILMIESDNIFKFKYKTLYSHKNNLLTKNQFLQKVDSLKNINDFWNCLEYWLNTLTKKFKIVVDPGAIAWVTAHGKVLPNMISNDYYTSMSLFYGQMRALLEEKNAVPITLTGDGSFIMNLPVLKSLLEINKKFIIVLFNNRIFNLGHSKNVPRKILSDETDFAKMFKALGGDSYKIDLRKKRPQKTKEIFEDLIESEKPCLFEVIIPETSLTNEAKLFNSVLQKIITQNPRNKKTTDGSYNTIVSCFKKLEEAA